MTVPPPANFYRRYRYAIFAALVISLPGMMYGAKQAWDETANQVMDWLPDSFAEIKELRWFFNLFGSEELLMVSWPGCTIDDPALARLAARLREPVVDADGGSRQLFRHVFTGPEVLQRLTSDPLDLDQEEALRRMRGWLVGSDNRTSCLVAVVGRPGMDDRPRAIQQVYDAAQRELKLPLEAIHIAGSTMDSVALDQTAKDSLMALNGLSLLVCFVLLVLFLRNFWLALLVFGTAVYCQQLALSLVWYTGGQMDSVLLMVGTLAYVLAMSASIHLVNYYRDACLEAAHAGPRHISPAIQAVRYAWTPSLLAAGTTALGMGALAVSELKPLYKFGVYSATTVIVTCVVFFLFVPAGLEQWPAWFRPYRTEEGAAGGRSERRWNELARLLGRWHLVIVGAAALLLLTCAAGTLRLTTTAKFHKFFAGGAPILRDYAWLESNLGPLVPLELAVCFPRDPNSNALQRLQLVERIRQELAQAPGVGCTISAATFAPSLKLAPVGSVWRPGQRVLLRSAIERHRQDFIASDYLAETADEEIWRISVRVPTLSDADYGQVLASFRNYVDPVLAEVTDETPVRVVYTGGIPLIHRAQRQLLEDLIKSFLCAFLLIALAIIVLLWSIPAGLAAMLPNVLPSVLVLGLMGWCGLEVEVGAILTASAALGIAVDDSLHFITWFRRGARKGMSREGAVVYAFRHCGIAMIQTSLVCGLGLLMFSLSSFVPIARFAWLMFALLTVALVCDLILLPAMLIGPLGRLFVKAEPIPATPAVETQSP